MGLGIEVAELRDTLLELTQRTGIVSINPELGCTKPSTRPSGRGLLHRQGLHRRLRRPSGAALAPQGFLGDCLEGA
eukprot:6308583-Heterocapsa_arctica.AAC.1